MGIKAISSFQLVDESKPYAIASNPVICRQLSISHSEDTSEESTYLGISPLTNYVDSLVLFPKILIGKMTLNSCSK